MHAKAPFSQSKKAKQVPEKHRLNSEKEHATSLSRQSLCIFWQFEKMLTVLSVQRCR